ncbi:MAG: CDP-glycerol glycerophosphotransferase family protein [Lachnospiraceae bacterium]|nr:CDP-glycerol glycerophosphotransferase family protein [Lachnospiraceae bacterium]
MAQEDFPIRKEAVEHFAEVNRRQWSKDAAKTEEKYVFVNLSMVRMQMAWVVPKLLYAKGVADTLGAKVIVITWREQPLLDEVCDSYGFTHYCIEKEDKKNLRFFAKALTKVLFFMLRDGTGSGLQKMKIPVDLPGGKSLKRLKAGAGSPKQSLGAEEYNAGRAIYEDILRTSELSTIRSARNKICIKKATHILWMFYTLQAYCKKHPPVFALADDAAYHEALISSLFRSCGAKVINSNQEQEMVLGFDDNGNPNRMHLMMQKKYREMIDDLGDKEVERAEQILEERFRGKNGRDIDRGAFKDKRVLTREEAVEELHLDPKKKNVVIMAHTFTDAVYNYGDLFYRDYYDWTENTLALAAKNDKVNWILKPHPTRSAYHESQDSIEDMFARYKKDNMFFLSDEFSAESIKNLADVLITIGSNAGGEFSVVGIPTVIVGKPFYGNLGFTIEPATKKGYEDCLMNIQDVKPLSEEQIRTAKKAFYLRNHYGPAILGTKYDDEFGSLVNEQYNHMGNKMALAYFESNRGTEKYNTQITENITEYMEQHDMKTCKYYTQGVLRAKEIS